MAMLRYGCHEHMIWSDMTSVVLARHGQSEWNKLRRWQGQADVALAAEGREQAKLLAARLARAGEQFDHIYASDLGRALETAQIVAAALHMPVHPLIELREFHIGAWSGLTSDEIKTRFPNEWTIVESGGDCRRGGDGETRAEFGARVAAVIEHLVLTHPGQRLLVVTHGGTIHAALDYVIYCGGTASHPHIDNTSLTEIVFDRAAPRITRLNDIAHLEEATTTAD